MTAGSSRTVYDETAYWDLAFRDETADELAFLSELSSRERRAGQAFGRLYEPGCGGGRLVIAATAAGFEVSACDLSEPAITYVNRRLRRRGLEAEVEVGDMRSWKPRASVDVAICPVNTFRHLLNDADALAHLSTVAAAVRPGGYYAIGLHLLPPDAAEDDGERWTSRHSRTSVTVTLRVVAFDRRKRIERLRFNLLVRSGETTKRFRTEFDYRIYTARQIRKLLEAAEDWTLESVHDFWWDLNETLELNDDRGDTVLLLRRV